MSASGGKADIPNCMRDRIGLKFMTWKEWLARTGTSSSLPGP